jgi:hypothetical protein
LQKLQRDWLQKSGGDLGNDTDMPKAIGCANRAEIKTTPQAEIKTP